LQLVEGENIADRNDELAIQNKTLRLEFLNLRHHVGEVTRERCPSVAAGALVEGT